ncbi:hypothetical protein H2202_011120 [Exophiala xenobiotica]|nr:hypothetical protein H2202_011120 [Exophiala xenobiotica]KAK5215610.1 hypothetical protein LTR72_011352 [Exophiala xenobiotica]KAK5284106.1 hypothetical protein LTR14_011760 [Exophiala xenobiotica]KAK5312559.1 hypothetical protein LTR93_011295 [Exophiala xenobiotica]KAK5469104.1 hypothetical protein LTR55_011368 [Exophiala xenobiotica]
MFALEERKSRKRQRSSPEPEDFEPEPIAKKQKSLSESRNLPRHRPPSFWDTLSKIRLSRGALREFDRRNIEEKVQSPCTITPKVEYPTGRARLLVKRFARRGGPDLSHLRGLANLPPPSLDRMSDYTSSSSRKRSSASSRPSDNTKTTSTKITPYSGNFEQKLIDNGIYPDEYEYLDGRLTPEPANLHDIKAAQRVPRASLSPSRFTDEHFKAFKRANARASGETTALYKVLPFIAGNETTHHFEMSLPLSNLKPFDKDLSEPSPDVYHGAALSTIHPRVRADLAPYIIPSMTDTSRPAAPNFFVEGKSDQGRADVARRQAMHDGAFGARAIHELRNYKAAEPEYDDKARSFSTTYHAGTGTLQTYVHHLTAPLTPGGESEYHMTQTNSYAMTGNANSFREGATAYRNDRDLAKTERDSSIAHANQVARQMPAPTPNTSFTTSRASRSTVVAAGSDTSEDELARDEVTPVKRLRPAPVHRSHDHASTARRSGRASTSFSLQHSTETDLVPPQRRAQSSTKGREPSTRSDSMDHPQPSGKTAQSLRNATEVPAERMRRKNESGWCIEYQGKSIFVPDARWTPCEKNRRQGLYYGRLNVIIYRSATADRQRLE